MSGNNNNFTNQLTTKLSELKKLIDRTVFNNADAYTYYFNKWHAEVLYTIEQHLGEKSKIYSRIEKVGKLPAGKATERQWIRYRRLTMTKSYAELQAVIATYNDNNKQLSIINSEKNANIDSFIDRETLTNLRGIQSEDFDLSKLIALCEELDVCFSSRCYFASGMIMRSIVDHVSPIFGVNSFSEVANNYHGSKSFKESMNHLEKSLRKIADSFLHTQIRNKEVLVTKTRINFSQDFDVLLSEIIRILK